MRNRPARVRASPLQAAEDRGRACCASRRSRRIISRSSTAAISGSAIETAATRFNSPRIPPPNSPRISLRTASGSRSRRTMTTTPTSTSSRWKAVKPRRLTWHPAAGHRDRMEPGRQTRAVRIQSRSRQQPQRPILRSLPGRRLRAQDHEGRRRRGQLVRRRQAAGLPAVHHGVCGNQRLAPAPRRRHAADLDHRSGAARRSRRFRT